MKDSHIAIVRELPKNINGGSVDDLFATIAAIQATPAIAKFKFRIHNSGRVPAKITPPPARDRIV